MPMRSRSSPRSPPARAPRKRRRRRRRWTDSSLPRVWGRVVAEGDRGWGQSTRKFPPDRSLPLAATLPEDGEDKKLSRPDQLDRLVLAEQIKQVTQCLAARGFERGVARQDQRRVVARGAEIFAVRLDARDAEAGQAALARAEQVAFAAELQILHGDAEAVFGLAQHGQPRLGALAERRLVEQQASRVAAPAPDAPAQLMQLREPEAFGMLDHHDCGFRHINADLDYRGGDQKLRLARREARHGGIFFCALHAAMHQIDFFAETFAQFLEAFLRGGEIDLFGFLDQRADPIGALARVQRAYWVCPLVEESEKIDLAAAQERFEELRKRFGKKVDLVHGRMKGTEKDAAMARFAAGETQLLVATTVIEVGVDVPEATIMVIEHAERFGLAQLHQLRGRIGRGSG